MHPRFEARVRTTSLTQVNLKLAQMKLKKKKLAHARDWKSTHLHNTFRHIQRAGRYIHMSLGG